MKQALAVLAVVVAAGCEQPAAIDVQAARACHAFERFTGHQGSGDDVVAAVKPLMAGTADAQAAGRPAPKWSGLGANLISAVAADNSGDLATLQADGNKAADECATIPPAAKRAGGYTR
jgi:hypothetical protein